MSRTSRILILIAVLIPVFGFGWLVKESREQRARLIRIEAAQQSNLSSIEESIRGTEVRQMRSHLDDLRAMSEMRSEVVDIKMTLETHLRRLEYDTITKRPKSP